MATILLDSSIIIDVLNGKRGRGEYLADLLERGHLLACCAVNVTEVYAGMRDSEETATREFLDSLEFLPIGPEAAKLAGMLKREWRKKGQTLSYTDVNLAAVAIHHEISLITDNLKHFPMHELKLFPLAG